MLLIILALPLFSALHDLFHLAVRQCRSADTAKHDQHQQQNRQADHPFQHIVHIPSLNFVSEQFPAYTPAGMTTAHSYGGTGKTSQPRHMVSTVVSSLHLSGCLFAPQTRSYPDFRDVFS